MVATWNNMTDTVGERIKARRIYLDLTQVDLARRLNVSRVSISNWESGKRGIDSSEIPRLAQALDVDESYFFGKSEYHIDDVPPDLERVFGMHARVLKTLPPGEARSRYIKKLEADDESYLELLRTMYPEDGE